MNIKIANDDLGRLNESAYRDAEKMPIYVILDNVRSAQNVGSFFRTMDAFRCEKLVLCGICAQPPHREINKTALGATESVEWEYFEDTIDAVDSLRAKGVKVFAVEQATDSISLDDWTSNADEKIALVFGNEVMGVDQGVIDKCDGCIEIPQFGTKHSLNIAVCAGITIWHIGSTFRSKLTPEP